MSGQAEVLVHGDGEADVLISLRRLSGHLFWVALAVIVAGELWPHLEIAPPWDKAAHIVAYFGLAGLATASTANKWRAFGFLIALFLLGGCLEIAQGYTGRDPDIFDALANVIGASAGWLIGTLAMSLLPRYVALWSMAGKSGNGAIPATKE
jgi:VanZ family protein